VPAVAVKRRERVLFVVTGCKTSVDGKISFCLKTNIKIVYALILFYLRLIDYIGALCVKVKFVKIQRTNNRRKQI